MKGPSPQPLPIPEVRLKPAPQHILPAGFKDILQRADERRVNGDLVGAVEDYTQAITLVPQSVAALYGRARAHDELHDYASSIRDATAALDLQPDDPGMLFGRGLTKERSKDHPGAIADYTRSLELRPDSTVLWYRGLAKEASGDVAGAQNDFRASLKGPDDATKRTIQEDIRGKKRTALILTPVALVVWVITLALLKHWTDTMKQDEKSWWNFAYLLLFMGSGWFMSQPLELYGKSKGYVSSGDGIFRNVFLVIGGPATLLVCFLYLLFQPKCCRVCATSYRFTAKECRRCTAPL